MTTARPRAGPLLVQPCEQAGPLEGKQLPHEATIGLGHPAPRLARVRVRVRVGVGVGVRVRVGVGVGVGVGVWVGVRVTWVCMRGEMPAVRMVAKSRSVRS